MSHARKTIVTVLAAGLSSLAVVSGQNYNIDTKYPATSLTGWHVLGDATWRAEGGEYVGTPKSPKGGWLVLDKSLQDVGVFGRFKCTAACKTGVLLRAEKTADGMKGLFVALTGDEPGSYAITLDAAGVEKSRERLRSAGGQVRFAPPPPPAGTPPRGGGGGGGRGRGATPANLPLTPPVGGLKADDWNLIEILLDASIVRPFLNESPFNTAAADDPIGKFGPVALYAGGSGEVRFKDVGTSDLSLKTLPAERVGSNFRLQRVNELYYSWGGAVGDFNHDGVNDIAAGPYVYLGPDYTKSREIYLGPDFNL